MLMVSLRKLSDCSGFHVQDFPELFIQEVDNFID